MTKDQIKGIVIKSLNRVQRYKITGLEDVAECIAGDIADYSDMVGGLGSTSIGAALSGEIGRAPAYVSPSPENLISIETKMPTAQVWQQQGGLAGNNVRINARQNQVIEYSEEEILDIKTKAIEQYRSTLPDVVEVTLVGAVAPIRMIKHQVSNSPGAMPVVNISYIPEGAASEAQIIRAQVDVTKPAKTPAQIVQEIVNGSRMVLSPVPRSVTSRMPTPISGGIGDSVGNEPVSEKALAELRGASTYSVLNGVS